MQLTKTDSIFCVFAAVVFLFTSWVIYYTLPFKHVFELIFAALILFKYHDFSKRNKNLYLIFVFISLWYYRPADFDFSVLATGIYKSLLFGLIFFLPKFCLRNIFKYFRLVLCVLVAYGVVFHILRLLGVFTLPEIAVVFSDYRYYEVYPLLVYQFESAMRFSSIFDEPGYLGTLSIFVLILGGMNLRKWYNLVLLIGGILSLSFAFYVMLAIVLGIYMIKSQTYYILLVIGAVVYLINKYLPEFFIPFLERNEMAVFFGGTYSDNRGDSEEAIRFIHNTPFVNILIGNGYDSPMKYFRDNNDGLASSSIWRMILQIGYMGVLSVVLFITKYTRKYFSNILFTIIFVLSIYQRPHIFEMIFIFFLACGFNVISDGVKEKDGDYDLLLKK